MSRPRVFAACLNRLPLLAVAFCALGATTVDAGGVMQGSTGKAKPKLVSQVAVKKTERLNLLAGRRMPAGERISALQIGRGSYICTPAGFGQRSRCRRN